MLDQPSVPRSSQFSLSEADIERRKVIADVTAISHKLTLKDIFTQESDRCTADFFRYLRELGEAQALFGRRDALAEARRRQRNHLAGWASTEYGRDDVEQRIAFGLLYSQYGLETRVFLGAFHYLLRTLGGDIMKRFSGDTNVVFQRFMSLKQVVFFDIGIITDVLMSERERTISQQQDAIRELSTPVLQLRHGLLILPIIGMIDQQRAKQLTDGLLHAIRSNRARMVVMDITGVAAVDSKVANRLRGRRAVDGQRGHHHRPVGRRRPGAGGARG
jgi:rsbT co-antagonist protein RsbR